jgi:hypothetical protein
MGGPSHNEHERQPGAARHSVADTPVPTRLNIGTRCLITERRGFTVKTGAGTADLALSLVVRLAIVGAPEFVDLSLVAC